METQAQVTAPREQFPATVVAVVDAYTVVVNRGSDHGIRQGQRFLIYTLSQEELVDPESRESLGRLEIVKGTGRAAHVQPRLTTIRSDGQSYEAPKRIVRKR